VSEADEARARTRAGWESAAGGWGRWREVQQAGAQAVSQWLVAAIAPQPGQTVVEVAAGAGETGFLAAAQIQPGGTLISSDGAEAMLEVARARAAELGLSNVQFKAMEAEWLDLGAASVDAILCRWGYMLLLDPEAALRDARRVLRPGGRVALAVWDDAELNPFITSGRVTMEAAGVPAPPAGGPGPFALADRDALRELLLVAGFEDVEIAAVDVETRLTSLDEAFAMSSELSPTLRAGLRELSPADHTRARDGFDAHLAPYVQADRSLIVPGRTLVAAASA
jgi:SAM-dependent methyltransferase